MIDESHLIHRPTSRVVLLDAELRVLLFQFEDHSITDPNDPDTIQPSIFWVTPGGGAEPGESFEQAAHRELLEETGIVATLGPMIYEREKVMRFGENLLHFDERYFLVRLTRADVSLAGQTDLEKRLYRAHRWWTLAELDQTTEVVFPPGLADIIRSALD